MARAIASSTEATVPDCNACKNTGWIMCDHTGERDEDGWCIRCSGPGDLAIDGLVKTRCDCES